MAESLGVTSEDLVFRQHPLSVKMCKAPRQTVRSVNQPVTDQTPLQFRPSGAFYGGPGDRAWSPTPLGHIFGL